MRNCDITTNIKAKLFASFQGLQKAWNDGFRNIICESDPKLALELIQTNIDVFHPHYYLIMLDHSTNVGI